MRAFLFPGQGSQYVGMGQALCEEYDVAKKTFSEADEALGFSLTDLIMQGPLETLTETENNQPAILTMSVATLRVLKERGHQPEMVAGHSLGEYSALVAADALDFADAVRLVRLRGRAMQDAVPLGVGTMAAIIKPSAEEVEAWCAEVSDQETVVEPAGYNCPGQTVVAGHVAAVERLMEVAQEHKARAVQLQVSAPFHSSLLKPAGEELGKALAEVTVRDPKIPYVPNVNAEPHQDASLIKDLLVEQVSKPVRWEPSMRAMMGAGVDDFLEVGPGKALLGFCRKIDRKMSAGATDDPKTWETLV